MKLTKKQISKIIKSFESKGINTKIIIRWDVPNPLSTWTSLIISQMSPDEYLIVDSVRNSRIINFKTLTNYDFSETSEIYLSITKEIRI